MRQLPCIIGAEKRGREKGEKERKTKNEEKWFENGRILRKGKREKKITKREETRTEQAAIRYEDEK